MEIYLEVQLGILSGLFGATSRNNKLIDRAIRKMGEEPSFIGTAWSEISYDDVIAYIKTRGCTIQRVIKKDQGDWISFFVDLDNTRYDVSLDKTFEGNGSVITVLPPNS